MKISTAKITIYAGKLLYLYIMAVRIGNGFDVHRLNNGLPLWICGVRIEHSKGCIAHSDGDTPIHALCDALLGSLALGDIGKYFPDTSDEFKNIDSKILLHRVYEMVKTSGYSLVNADITILLQRPKLANYISLMRETLAGVMEIDSSIISIKATTTEELGFIGKEEGIAAFASVIVEKLV